MPLGDGSTAKNGHPPLQFLCLEDNVHDAELLGMRLQSDGFGFEMTRVDTRQGFAQALERGKYDLIISDYSIPAFSGREALELAREKKPELPFIFFSGTIGEERAIECLKRGATDFVLKDHPTRLVSAIRRALADVQARLREKQTEAALRSRDAQIHALVEQSLFGVYIIQDGKWEYINPTMAHIVGREPEDLMGRPVLELIVPEDRIMVADNIRKRIEGAVSSVRYQLRMLHRNGGAVNVEVHGASTVYNGIPAIMGVLLDITERKKTEAQIEEQAALLDKALNAIVVQDLSRRIRYWNAGAQRLYGWSSEEVLGKPADALIFGGGARHLDEAHILVMERGEWHGEFKHYTRDGKEIMVESHWSLIRDDAGGPKSIFVVTNDITEKMKVDAQVRRTQRLDSIGTLAGGIAHDLNNVLSPIFMSLSLLRDEIGSETGQKMIEILEASARRGAAMVKQILLFARGTEGERSAIQLNHVTGDLVKVLRQMFPRSIEIELRTGEGVWPIMGDATQLHQVFLNLCVNARDAMPNGGLLRLETANVVLDDLEARMFGASHAGPYVLTTVADSGTGIPPEVLDKIFEPFFTTKEVGKGTGLGLSTAVGIIKGLDGFVKVYSEMGRGTAFRVYLPAHEFGKVQAETGPRAEPPMGRGETILLVDDEAALREITRAALEKRGYEVLVAGNGAEAVAVYAQRRDQISIVITDMTMPIMDGPATIHALRNISPALKIIAVSGLMVDLKAAHVEPSPNLQFLAKPFDTEKLLVTLRQMLEKPE